MSDDGERAETEAQRQWFIYNDNLLHSRIGFWIAAQSIMFGLVAEAIGEKATGTVPPTNAVAFAAYLGFLLAGVWLVTGRNVGQKLARARAPLAKRWPYLTVFNEGGGSRRFSSALLLVTFLPGVFLVAWGAVIAKILFCW